LQPGTGQRGIAASTARWRSSSLRRPAVRAADAGFGALSDPDTPAVLAAARRDFVAARRGSGLGA
jgi:hypothetical protein